MDIMTQHLVDIVSVVRGAAIQVPSLGVHLPLLEILHAIFISYTYRTALHDSHSEIGWGQGVLATIVMGAGGGSTVALICGDPLGILKNNSFWCLYSTMYWLMFSNPYFYQFLQYIFSIPIVEETFAAADGVMRATGVVMLGVDRVSQNPELGPDKWAAKIICGTLAGCGGGLWVDAFRLNSSDWSFSTPRLLHTASIDMKVSFITSTFYTLVSIPGFCEYWNLPVLNHEEALAWTVLVFSSGTVYRTYATRQQRRLQTQHASAVATVASEKKDQ